MHLKVSFAEFGQNSLSNTEIILANEDVHLK